MFQVLHWVTHLLQPDDFISNQWFCQSRLFPNNACARILRIRLRFAQNIVVQHIPTRMCGLSQGRYRSEKRQSRTSEWGCLKIHHPRVDPKWSPFKNFKKNETILLMRGNQGIRRSSIRFIHMAQLSLDASSSSTSRFISQPKDLPPSTLFEEVYPIARTSWLISSAKVSCNITW